MAAELDESEEEAGCCNGERFGRHQIHCLRNKMASKCGKVRHLEAFWFSWRPSKVERAVDGELVAFYVSAVRLI